MTNSVEQLIALPSHEKKLIMAWAIALQGVVMSYEGGRDESWVGGAMNRDGGVMNRNGGGAMNRGLGGKHDEWRLVSEFIASRKNNACAYWAFEIA